MSQVRKYRIELLDPFGVVLFALETYTDVDDTGVDVFTGFLMHGNDPEYRRAPLGNDQASYSVSVSRRFSGEPQ